MLIVRLMAKNQVVIPRKIRAQLGLNKGDQLKALEVNQKIILRPSPTPASEDNSHVTLDSRGRIALPASIINSLGIKMNNLLKVSLLLDEIMLSPIKLSGNTSYIARLNADHRTTMPDQLLQILRFPKTLFLTPVPDRTEILLSTASAKDSHCCPIRSDKRITINKKLRLRICVKPGDAIALTLNPYQKLIIEEENDLLDSFTPFN